MPRLIFRQGARTLLEYKLPPGRTLLGRADACDLVIPGSTVSRTHCVLTLRNDRVTVRDRSRHGTTLNGAPLSGVLEIQDGDVLGIGGFELALSMAEPEAAAPTSSSSAGALPPEQLIAVDDGLMLERLVLVVDAGPAKGRRALIDKSRRSVGGSPSSQISLDDPSLKPTHFLLLVVRGRAMITPKEGAVYLDGERLMSTTPVYLGEQVRVGDTAFHLEAHLEQGRDEAGRFGKMVGLSRQARHTFGLLRRMADHVAPVLLIGESGTGKELAARGLHDEGARAGGSFVALNCGAISESLFESELFGHERGAFTGADRRTDGAFHKADGGTLFLDEIGELPEGAQAKLLRALESGEVRRVGGTEVSYPDVRVVAATNRDLAAEVSAGRFRGDLFFRLAVLAVRMPPLRERPEDLAPIAEALAAGIHPELRLTDAALDALAAHDFPGNVRELRNILTRAYVLGGFVIDAADITFTPWSFEGAAQSPLGEDDGASRLESNERALVLAALRRHDGNRSAAARELGIARSTLHYKIRRYQLDG
ncbi:MAG: sigma 54-interacting transcriptional regulator [Alphaproteobacteria bacterium]|nr:sigma 54-interacting transcriptional regulator [Alphaproteobacteria bacterium]